MKKKEREKHTWGHCASSPIRPGVGVDIDNTRVCGGDVHWQNIFYKIVSIVK
jgi:hypothetical protein